MSSSLINLGRGDTLAELHVHDQQGKVRVVKMERPEVCLGREPVCDIVLDDVLVSRRHARIRRDPENVLWVEDLGSKNGTTVNDQPVQIIRVREGDRVGIGPFYVVLRRLNQTRPKVVMEDADTTQCTTSNWNHEQGLSLPQQRLIKLYGLFERLSGKFERDELLNEVANLCVDSLGLHRVGIALWEDDPTPERWVVLKSKQPSMGGEFRMSRTLVHLALREAKPSLYTDKQQQMVDPTESMISNNIKSAMCVPLQYHNRVRGVLYGDRVSTGAPYTKEDLDFFAALGRQAAMALVNVELLEENMRRRRVEEQLRMAREIQIRLFPREPLSSEHYCIDALNDPGFQVSGDYFDYFQRADGCVVVVIADVSGKGVPAAMLMANLQAAVHVLLYESADLLEATRRLNRLICQNVASERFITATFGLLNPVDRTFSYVNAGHPFPLSIMPDGVVQCLPEAASLPLGVEPEADYQLVTHQLPATASTLFFYTDGVPDAENDKDEHFGEERLTDVLGGAADEEPHELVTKVRRYIQQFIRQTRQIDDITMLALRMRPVRN